MADYSFRSNDEVDAMLVDLMTRFGMNTTEAIIAAIKIAYGQPPPLVIRPQMAAANDIKEFVGALEKIALPLEEVLRYRNKNHRPGESDKRAAGLNRLTQIAEEIWPKLTPLVTTAKAVFGLVCAARPEALSHIREIGDSFFRKARADAAALSAGRISNDQRENYAKAVRQRWALLHLLYTAGIWHDPDFTPQPPLQPAFGFSLI